MRTSETFFDAGTSHRRVGDRLAFIAVALYFSAVVFGNLFRQGEEEIGPGLSTLLLLLIVAARFRHLLRPILNNSLYSTIAALLAWCAFSGLFSATSVTVAYRNLVMLSIYLLASAAVYSITLTEYRMRVIFYGLAFSMFVASFLTIVDFVHVYDVPYVNENQIDTKIDGERVEQAGGFFDRRSAMAAYYSLIIAALFYLAFKTRNRIDKLVVTGAAVTGFTALFLTHNRSGILGIIISVLLYMAIDRTLRLQHRVNFLLLSTAMLGLLMFMLYQFLPVHFEVYVMKLASYIPGLSGYGIETESRYLQSDYARVHFFTSAIENLMENPIGNGFSKIYSVYGASSPHNILTLVIWAAGVMAFVWIPVFALQVRKHFGLARLKRSGGISHPLLIYVTALQVGLLSWLLNNMAHNSLSTGLAWMFLGLVLKLMWMARQASVANRFLYSDQGRTASGNDRKHLVLTPSRPASLVGRSDAR